MIDTWSCAWRELRRRKARAITCMCGYALAVAVTIIVGTTFHLSREQADRILASTGTHFIAFVPAASLGCPGCTVKTSDMPQEGFLANGVPSALFPLDFVEHIKNLPTIKDASPFLLFRFKNPQDHHTFTIGGFDVNNNVAVRTTCCATTDIVKGRFLTTEDRGNVLLEEAYAQLKSLKVGDQVRVADRAFSVVGIVNPGIRPAKADIYMPFDEAEQVIGLRMPSQSLHKEANVVLVEVARASLQKEAIHSVQAFLSGFIVSSYACYKPASEVMVINERAALLLTGILGLAVLLLAAKTEWAWVIERRREIGILKAIGWTNGNILGQILAESILQAGAGSIVGAAAAIIFMWVLSSRMITDSHTINPVVIISVIAVAVVAGLLAGIGPALVGAQQRPAEALRVL